MKRNSLISIIIVLAGISSCTEDDPAGRPVDGGVDASHDGGATNTGSTQPGTDGGDSGGSEGQDDGGGGRGDGGGGQGDGGEGDGSVDPVTECSTDQDCETNGRFCDLLDGQCVECVYDIDCEADSECLDELCVTTKSCGETADCADDGQGRTACDLATGECVECTAAADCADSHDCVDNGCVAIHECINSLDCPGGMFCNRDLGRCFDCTKDADCGDGSLCVDNKCRQSCDSDADCLSSGLLCNDAEGYCGECVTHRDCDEAFFCSKGDCVLDVCRAETSDCEDNAIVECSDEGDRLLSPSACDERQTCFRSETTASCEDWICQEPGTRTCDLANEKIIECAEDGLSTIEVTDCTATDKACVDGSCIPVICAPNGKSCDGDDKVMACNEYGTEETEDEDCATDEFCDDADPACKAQICLPDQPACDHVENVATTCNSRGSGYTGAQTDCDATTDICAEGDCVDPLVCGDGTICYPLNVSCNTITDGSTTGNYCSCNANFSGSRTLCSTSVDIGFPPAGVSYSAVGLWFQAPSDFTITGVRVSSWGSDEPQTVQVVRINSFDLNLSTSDIVTLEMFYQIDSSAKIETNIPVSAGQYIGLLGTRNGETPVGADGYYETEIDGLPVTLNLLQAGGSIPVGGVTSVTLREVAGQFAPAYGSIDFMWQK